LFAVGHNQEKLTKQQIGKICELKNSENELIKEGLVSALNGIDNINAIETLIHLSYDKFSHIRDWATFGLGTQIDRNNKKIRDALWNRVNDKNQETRLEAIFGLAKRKDIRAKDIAKRELISGEYGTLLFEAILEIGDADFLLIMKQHYKKEIKNKNINPEWLKDLKNCILELNNKIKTNG
jgi:HEAT repeat protein